MDCGGGMTWSYDLIIKTSKEPRWRSPRSERWWKSAGKAPHGRYFSQSWSTMAENKHRLHMCMLFSSTSINMSFTLKPLWLLITYWNFTYDYPSSLSSLGWVRGGDKFPTESSILVYTCNTVQSHFWVFLNLYTHTPYIPVQTAPLPNPSNRKQKKTLGRDRGKESWSWSHRRSGMSNQPWQWDDWAICVIFATSIKN